MDNSITYYLPHDRLQELISALNEHHICIGPQVRDGAIVYDRLTQIEQLPWNMREEQSPGRYQLKKVRKHLAFAWANGPQAIKPFLFKPYETLWYVKKEDKKLQFEPVDQEEVPIAIFGARPCDIAAMIIQDKVFINDQYIDFRYEKRRKSLFIVAVNCTYSSDNCFCVSAGGSTKATQNFDVVMTELKDGFIVLSGSDKGKALLESLKLTVATDKQKRKADAAVNKAARGQSKKLPKTDLRQALFANLEHERWNEVATRCLSCGNCTQVCPTCFCHEEFDRPNIDGESSQHIRAWDSCFTSQHSHLFTGPVRQNTREYYRQWLTHKLGSWHDQFGTSGCVGCGRCITWCPVGIDITEEATAICSSTMNSEDSKHE